VAKLYENLNLSMSMFKKHLFALRDQRVLDGAGKQGVTKWVTMADFKQIRRDLRSLEVTLGCDPTSDPKPKLIMAAVEQTTVPTVPRTYRYI
jgi:hypothetical protein